MIFAKRNLVAILLGAVLAQPVLAQSDPAAGGFDPRENCSAVLTRTGDLEKVMVAAWTYGYLAAAQDKPGLVDLDNIRVMLRNLTNACSNNDQLSLLALVQGSRSAPADQPGSEANARLMLEKFLQPGADIDALTQALFPDEADIRAVYRDPVAGLLVQNLLPRFRPGVKFTPKPEHDAILLARATTDQLIAGDPVLRDFPGGYSKVLPYMLPGVPIVRFKFVKSGETLGLAFDGLVYVNDHWVIIPKPWRYLE
jgi:hypothetical protein